VDPSEARRRFGAARVARLATVGPDDAPHLVPFVFATDGDRIYSAVDDKPKRSKALTRLANIRSHPEVSVLADHYDEDWGGLWWIRADGIARVVESGPDLDRAVSLLSEKYPQYRDRPPTGPAIVIEVRRWRSWSAS
jgi:PPOX class probable F420-dependent enzyme